METGQTERESGACSLYTPDYVQIAIDNYQSIKKKRLLAIIFSCPLKDALLLNSQYINTQFALKYLQVFVSLQSETCRYYDKKDLSAALLVQFVGRPTEPQTSLVSARRQD